MSSNARCPGPRRRSLLGALIAVGIGASSTSAGAGAVDLLARLDALGEPDDDDERLALTLREALLDVRAERWRGAVDAGRTTLWSRGPLRLDRVVVAPRAALPTRLVTDAVTVTRAVAGLARYAFHEPVEDDDGVFVVRRTREGVLVPGRMIDATRARDTIRSLRAGDDGVELLELVAARTPPRPTRDVDVARTPFDAFAGLHAARWIEPESARPR